MASYKQFYLPYVEGANVNYIYLLYLYSVAVKNNPKSFDILHPNESIKSDINFKSWKELENRINEKLQKFQEIGKNGKLKTLVSSTTLSRMVKSGDYDMFFGFDEVGTDKLIVLFNDFSGLAHLAATSGSSEKVKRQSFVALSSAMIDLLLETKDNFLAQYLIYLVHYCRIAKNKGTDFTAKQFLSATGYSIVSNNNLSKVSECNKILVDRGIINIKKWKDGKGHERNTYTLQPN